MMNRCSDPYRVSQPPSECFCPPLSPSPQSVCLFRVSVSAPRMSVSAPLQVLSAPFSLMLWDQVDSDLVICDL